VFMFMIYDLLGESRLAEFSFTLRRLPAGRRGSQVDHTYPGGSITPAPPPRLPQRTGAAARPRGYLPVVLGVHRSSGCRTPYIGSLTVLCLGHAP
jgi:hypothetical protein